MTLFIFCLAGTGFSYFLGTKWPGKGYGTVQGWTVSLSIGIFLGLLYFVYSAYGLLFSLDSIF